MIFVPSPTYFRMRCSPVTTRTISSVIESRQTSKKKQTIRKSFEPSLTEVHGVLEAALRYNKDFDSLAHTVYQQRISLPLVNSFLTQ